MMKKILAAILICFSAYGFVSAQARIELNGGYGYYLSNSENATRIMNGRTFRSSYLFGLSFQKDNIWGMNFGLEYNYSQASIDKVFRNPVFENTIDNLVGYTEAKMTLITHNFDLTYRQNLVHNFSAGLGPSFVIVNRVFEYGPWLYDKLASSGIGLNIYMDYSLPLTSHNDFYFISRLKVRYMHSVWFDEGIRDLSNYKQEFVTAQLSAGLAYSL